VRSRGNSSFTIAKASGKTAPPVPWSTRNPISDQMSHAAAAPMQPTRKTARLIASSRSFPCWSPSLPRRGVRTAELSRKPVKIQVVHVVVVCRSRRSSGNAGSTIVCWSA
jgi:hypothetical protein